ncbi:MAG: thioredoxin domain-containing protein [Anaerolineales bacterium]|nr:thioredoxin domain-containing protein [Anaerolineales bacterium]NUQ83207.1 thioredoxin fold domain-containing protein [Anaerolineales bacterium]
MPKSNRAKRKYRPAKNPPTLLILAGIALLLIAVFLAKGSGVSTASTLESQLDEALAAKHPTFVFLHSLDCIPCKEMMGTVAEVYPEFQDSVTLIDVDVYDQNNTNILRRENLQSIPTLVFYDAQGTRQVFVGVMQADQFRQTLSQLAQ